MVFFLNSIGAKWISNQQVIGSITDLSEETK